MLNVPINMLLFPQINIQDHQARTPGKKVQRIVLHPPGLYAFNQVRCGCGYVRQPVHHAINHIAVDPGGRPLLMGIFKPSLGLSAADHASLLEEVCAGGLDIVKDDEIMPDLPGAPTAERLAACRAVLDRATALRGRPMLYAVNVTGRADRLRQKLRQTTSPWSLLRREWRWLPTCARSRPVRLQASAARHWPTASECRRAPTRRNAPAGAR